jgi:hypothetical protein
VPPSADGEQTGVPPSTLHEVAHAPQFIAVVSETHAPPQSVYPAPHEAVQVPPTQAGWPFATAGQTFPHVPQLVTELVMSTQDPLHAIVLPEQEETHP